MLNFQDPDTGTQREINSSLQVKKLLQNLDNPDFNT